MNDVKSPRADETKFEGCRTIDSLVTAGARRMIVAATEAEVLAFIESHSSSRDEEGHRAAVRNGYLPARSVSKGAGSIATKAPRARDLRRIGQSQRKSRQRLQTRQNHREGDDDAMFKSNLSNYSPENNSEMEFAPKMTPTSSRTRMQPLEVSPKKLFQVIAAA